MSTDPSAERVRLVTEAEKRAGARQVRLLIVALVGLVVIAAFAVAGFFLAYSQAKKNAGLTREVIGQSTQIKSLTEQLTTLATDQAKNSQTGRDTLKKIADLTTLIASFTDPNSQATKDRAAQTAAALKSLLAGQQIQNADLLRKLGEMAVALGAPPDVVKRILAEPAPPIVIPSTAPAKPSSTAGASVGTAATAPKPCTGPVAIQATPLALPLLPPATVNVCIPAPKP